MERENLQYFRKAGRINAQARELGAKAVKAGAKLREVVELIENYILEQGAGLAFPAQTSRNHIAAHYCPAPNDETVYAVGDVVKIDLGAHIDGYVTDSAMTIDLSEDNRNQKLIDAARAALDAAIGVAGHGVPVAELGRVIAETIRSRGFNPIVNLTGHGVGRYIVHCRPQIPNFADQTSERLKAGMIIAVEPFATDGRGMIDEEGRPEVFMLRRKPSKTKRIPAAVLEAILEFRGLPFARRQLQQFPKDDVEQCLLELSRANVMVRYGPLVEAPGTKVAQWEHTLYIGESTVEVLTK